MCNQECVLFIAKSLRPEEARGKNIVEFGSRGAGVRPLVESWGPKSYLGVDVAPGPGVDCVLGVESSSKVLGLESFDIVISNELLEHVLDWRSAISSMKEVLKPGGRLLITTRSRGFPYHPNPDDFWRYEPDDMRSIFSDFELRSVERDMAEPGVFVDAAKPERYTPNVLNDIKLYSVLSRRRVRTLSPDEVDGVSARFWKWRYRLLWRATKFLERRAGTGPTK
jgi:SAM-dependent methyltransferase